MSTQCCPSVAHWAGTLSLAVCEASATPETSSGSAQTWFPIQKFGVTSKPPVGGISVITLIRTDTTLDHSQKAEKV